MQRLRQLWLRTHRWTALSLGWVLILSGLTGAVLVVAQPLDRWLHPELFHARTQFNVGAPDAALQGVLQALKAEWPKGSFTMRPAREPGESLWVLVNGPWRGTVYFDPATGLEQGRRGETEGFVNARSSCTARCGGRTRARPSWPGWHWPTSSCSPPGSSCGGRGAGRRPGA